MSSFQRYVGLLWLTWLLRTGSQPRTNPSARRLRRLQEAGRANRMAQVNAALRQVWEQPGGPRPDQVWVRPRFLLARRVGSARRAAPMSRLITSRGIALRFYLLAVFEAQCRPGTADPWVNTRPLSGRMGWSDLIAIDAAYSRPVKAYQRLTKQNRTLDSSLDRQIKGALRTLEQLEDQALVVVPLKANGRHRDYGRFLLMEESGRGEVPTPKYYTVPSPRRGMMASRTSSSFTAGSRCSTRPRSPPGSRCVSSSRCSRTVTTSPVSFCTGRPARRTSTCSATPSGQLPQPARIRADPPCTAHAADSRRRGRGE